VSRVANNNERYQRRPAGRYIAYWQTHADTGHPVHLRDEMRRQNVLLCMHARHLQYRLDMSWTAVRSRRRWELFAPNVPNRTKQQRTCCIALSELNITSSQTQKSWRVVSKFVKIRKIRSRLECYAYRDCLFSTVTFLQLL